MTIVCGIDPSLTSAGLAILTHGHPTYLASHGFAGHNGATYQTRNRRIRKQVMDISVDALRFNPDLIVIEEHPYAIRISAGEFDRSGLWHGLYGRFDSHDIPVAVMNNSTAKKWITGRGNAKKPDIIAAITEWWPLVPVVNDDEADALGLAAIGAFHLGDPMPFEVKERHTTGLESVAWPERTPTMKP